MIPEYEGATLAMATLGTLLFFLITVAVIATAVFAIC
jgi:hypothetical protein